MDDYQPIPPGGRFKSRIGHRIGTWTIRGYLGRSEAGRNRWAATCDCGAQCTIFQNTVPLRCQECGSARPVPSRPCAKCDAPQDPEGLGVYCIRHLRIRQMRSKAKVFGKLVPSVEEIDALVPVDMTCPVCHRLMNWRAGDGQSTVVTLQHDRDGTIRLLCMGCNARHARGLGDSIYTAPADMKFCRACKAWLPLDRFRLRSDAPRGVVPSAHRRAHCIPCTDVRERARYAAKQEKSRARRNG